MLKAFENLYFYFLLKPLAGFYVPSRSIFLLAGLCFEGSLNGFSIQNDLHTSKHIHYSLTYQTTPNKTIKFFFIDKNYVGN